MAVRENYFVANSDTLVVSGQKAYPIPTRAIGDKLKDVVIVDADGNPIDELVLIPDNEVGSGQIVSQNSGQGFYIEANNVILYPDETAWVGRYLRMRYFRRPNRLVPVTSTGKVTNIAGLVVTLDNVPTTWTTATELDVIQGKPPFNSRADGITVAGIAGFDLTLLALPTGLVIGDYFAEAQESPIPQLPVDSFGWLAQRGAIKALESVGNPAELQAHVAMADRMAIKFLTKITPRVDDQPKKIISRNGIFRNTRRTIWPR
jgi:hypothetical protein